MTCWCCFSLIKTFVGYILFCHIIYIFPYSIVKCSNTIVSVKCSNYKCTITSTITFFTVYNFNKPVIAKIPSNVVNPKPALFRRKSCMWTVNKKRMKKLLCVILQN